ncbi:MAG: hypothetical protein HY369_00830 [Candidatus Aenigmarchaeota archaeon]|nr:hypothetical protein [Candidatus Aenigmarchaeota archaeon]
MHEVSRQLIHLSGALFILLAQLMHPLAASLLFFLIALTFLLYSLHLRHERNRFARFLATVEQQVRRVVTHVERPGVPLQGAFWFYAACGLAFLLFPVPVATTATLILAVSDSLSTLVGIRLGRHRLVGDKTVEGTAAFFVSAAAVAFIFFPATFLLPAVAATAAELLPGLPACRTWRQRGILDDNLLIPLFAGAVLLL